VRFELPVQPETVIAGLVTRHHFDRPTRLARARTCAINSSSPFHLHPVKVRRLIFSDRGVLNAITQLFVLNSIANRHRTGSP
jgi:hypothetical protein